MDMDNRKEARNFALLCDMAELTALFASKGSVSDFLNNLVHMVASHMRVDVCSVYLFNEGLGQLVLRASRGLERPKDMVVTLKPGEGITGKAFEENRSIREGRARQNPYFKPIPGIEEAQFEAFLAVPIRRAVSKIGVLTIQDRKKNAFSGLDTRALKAIASQLATSLENAEALMEVFQVSEGPAFNLKHLDGSGAGSGVAIGQASILRTSSASFSPLKEPESRGPEAWEPESRSPETWEPESREPESRRPATILSNEQGNSGNTLQSTEQRHEKRQEWITEELTKFAHSLSRTKKQLETMQLELDQKVAEVADLIFSAHLLMLRDDKFSGAMQGLIQDGSSAEAAVVSVVNHFVRLFGSKDNPRIREKAQDVLDLGLRICRNLSDQGQQHGDYRGQIVITADIFPSELVKLAAQQAVGIVALGSGQTAHVALLARSLRLPALFVHSEDLLSIPQGSRLILDANLERLYINPDQDLIQEYQTLLARSPKVEVSEVIKDTKTMDGKRICVMANVNLIQDVEVALDCHAEGVGLYRSEFPFLVRNDFPSEEEQTRLYRRVIAPMAGKEVIIRTLDVGGDKLVGAQGQYREANPFLGYRGIRFSLTNPELFSDQLRAILRAGEGSDLGIMFPMICSLDEFLQARDFVYRCMDELRKEGLPHHDHPRIGAMIELPAAVEIVAELAEIADFLSVGTNDLIMYTLAVDRDNEQVGSLYTPQHPSVLRSLHRIVAGMGEKISRLSVCGEAVHDPALLNFLIGQGITKFSVDPHRIPQIKEGIQGISHGEAVGFATGLLELKSLQQVREYIAQQGKERERAG